MLKIISISLADQGAEGYHSGARHSLLGRRKLRFNGFRRRGAPRRRVGLPSFGNDPDAGSAGTREPPVPRLLPAATGHRESALRAPALHASSCLRGGCADPDGAGERSLGTLQLPRRHLGGHLRKVRDRKSRTFRIIMLVTRLCFPLNEVETHLSPVKVSAYKKSLQIW